MSPLTRPRRRRALALIAVLLALFSILACFAHAPGLLHFDTAFTRTLQAGHTATSDAIAYAFTYMGSGGTMSWVCIVAALVAYRGGKTRAALFCLLSLLGLPLNVLLKQIVQRPRPTADLVRVVYYQSGDSFPSGHAMGSTIVYGFLAYLAWIHLRHPIHRRFWALLLALLPIPISFSRIYLGVHWFSDIVGAWIFGLIVLLILAELYSVSTEAVAGAEPSEAP